MEILFGVIFCIIIGCVLMYVLTIKGRPSGTFVIDLSDPEKDICRLELDANLNEIYAKKKIILKVKTYE